MRTLVVYLLALASIALGAWFGLSGLLESGTSMAEGHGEASPPPPVVVTKVERAPFFDTLEALGTVRANESVLITSNRADHVAAIHFSDGQEVEAGHLLLEMHAEEETALLAEATAIRDQQRVQYKRVLELFESQNSSQRELDNAKTRMTAAEARVISLEAAIADRQVRAPFAGTLGLRRVSVGAYLQPGTVITTLDDLSIVKLDFTIPESWLPIVRDGMSIVAESDAWLGTTFEGVVVTLDTRLDARTRSATVRAKLPNAERKLRPGMLLKVTVQRGETPCLQVPEEALIPTGTDHHVFRVGTESIAERVQVEVGRRRVGVVEITRGLRQGDLVVVEGIVRVRPGYAVEIVDERKAAKSNGNGR